MSRQTQNMVMTPLPDQQLFEALLGKTFDERITQIPKITVVYFTADWCGACKRIDWPLIEKTLEGKKITWFKCDVDMNDYTLGYCGMKSIPSFVCILNGGFKSKLSSSNTEAIIEWIKYCLE